MSHSDSEGATSHKSKPMIVLPDWTTFLMRNEACSKVKPPGTGVPVFGHKLGFNPSCNPKFSGSSILSGIIQKIKDIKNLKNENIVKVITENSLEEDHFPKAVSFSRKSEQVDNIYHHIGIYCYSRDCLEKFVHLDQSKNEIENRLEQLRALDNNIDINVSLAKSSPIGVDTEEDYLALKKIMEYKN